jgi:hypothetical protein
MRNLKPRHPSIEEKDRPMTVAKQLPNRAPRHIAAWINSNLNLTKTATGLLCAFAIAAGAFWATMVISPPTTQARLESALNPSQMERSAASDLPSFEQKHHRYIGVLDVLAAP